MNKDKYVVYVHRRKDTNQIFYVGSGKTRRVNQVCNRSKGWVSVSNLTGFTSEILMLDLDKDQAREAEDLLIQMLSDQVVNVLKPVSSALDIPDNVLSLVYYDETSPTGLRWLKDRKPSIKAHDKAGALEFRNNDPHRARVCINGIGYACHRIIYKIKHGFINPELVIDHIDGNPHNNRIENLREVSNAENSRNNDFSRFNKTGQVGVHFKTNNDGNSHWVATWYENGKTKAKHFMIGKYGNDKAFQLACEFRVNKIKELNMNGAGYTERHCLTKE